MSEPSLLAFANLPYIPDSFKLAHLIVISEDIIED